LPLNPKLKSSCPQRNRPQGTSPDGSPKLIEVEHVSQHRFPSRSFGFLHQILHRHVFPSQSYFPFTTIVRNFTFNKRNPTLNVSNHAIYVADPVYATASSTPPASASHPSRAYNQDWTFVLLPLLPTQRNMPELTTVFAGQELPLE
jgi:hypothetical protein